MGLLGWAEADSSNGLFVSLYLSVAEVGCHVDQFDNPSPPCSCQDVVSFLAAVADHHREGCPCNAEELLGQKENKAGVTENSQQGGGCHLREKITVAGATQVK